MPHGRRPITRATYFIVDPAAYGGWGDVVEDILCHPRGLATRTVLTRTCNPVSANIVMRIVTEDELAQQPFFRDDLKGFSVTFRPGRGNTASVFFNAVRWTGGPDAPIRALPSYTDIHAYRHYLVNHEIIHALGFMQHLEPKSKSKVNTKSRDAGSGSNNDTSKLQELEMEPCPVMHQQTKVTSGCDFNPFPLPQDWNALRQFVPAMGGAVASASKSKSKPQARSTTSQDQLVLPTSQSQRDKLAAIQLGWNA